MINNYNIDLFAFTNLRMQRNRPTGILIELHALNEEAHLFDLVKKGRKWAEKNILFIYPYTSPWNWMNGDCVEFLDEILDIVLITEQSFDAIPIVVLGYSMGGHGALIYPAFSKHTISACAAVCPICDMQYHFSENTYVARTMISAYFHESDLNKALFDRSPLYITNIMPKIPYLILHCREDERVSIANHSDKLTLKMKCDNFNIIYHIIEKGGHCRLDDLSKTILEDFLTRNLTTQDKIE